MKRTFILIALFLLLVPVLLGQVVFDQDNFDNYIVFNRGLRLAEAADSVRISTGSSVWIVDPADTQATLTRVTPEENASSLMPSWGPGKTRIVFVSNRENAGATPLLDIWTIRADGSDLQRLTQDAGHNWTQSWSPDGTLIAFASTRNAPGNEVDQVYRFDVFVMNADGSDQRFLADTGGQDEDPVFSADNQTVYFVANPPGECFQIWQVPTAGGEASPLLDNANNIVCGDDPSLSPDGETLFFWSNSTGQFAGFDLATRAITTYSFDSLEPWIGPSGDQFTFMSDCDELINCNIFISDLQGNTVMQVTSGRQDFFPRWAGPDIITSVEQISNSVLPKEFRLQQNYPNPFNPSTTIQFALPKRSEVMLKIFDLLGREVTTLVDEKLQPGEYKVIFEAEALSSGVYFYRIQAEGFVQTKELTLLK